MIPEPSDNDVRRWLEEALEAVTEDLKSDGASLLSVHCPEDLCPVCGFDRVPEHCVCN